MKKLTGNQLRSMYIQYFVDQGHKQIKGASLIPENDPSVLFTTAGMHPLVPYLLGAKHPMGKMCIRDRFRAGPEVSLKGSPTVSPITAAL